MPAGSKKASFSSGIDQFGKKLQEEGTSRPRRKNQWQALDENL
jgi:hypothetical protein